MHEPRYAALAQRVLAIPDKRYTRRPVAYLDRDEIEALLKAPNPRTRNRTPRPHPAARGGADRTAGLGTHRLAMRGCPTRRRRLCALSRQGTKGAVHAATQGCGGGATGRGCKERRGESSDPVFPNQRGGSLSHDSLGYLLSKHLATARARCPSLAKKRVSVHSLRHSCAMELLQSGVDRAVIALWLGHESVETTYIYLHAGPETERAGHGPDRDFAHVARTIPARG